MTMEYSYIRYPTYDYYPETSSYTIYMRAMHNKPISGHRGGVYTYVRTDGNSHYVRADVHATAPYGHIRGLDPERELPAGFLTPAR